MEIIDKQLNNNKRPQPPQLVGKGFQKGKSGNPAGRPKEKTLKEYAREYFALKSEEDKRAYIDWLEEKKPGFAWTMAEGNPQNDINVGASDDLKDFLENYKKLF